MGIHLIIIGGESGPRARPCRVEWIRSLVRQCREASVPVFVKQLGANIRAETWGPGKMLTASDRIGERDRWIVADKAGADMSAFPNDLSVREMPRIPNDRATERKE